MLKIDDFVKVIKSTPYIKKGSQGYVNEVFSDGTASISKVDSDNEVFVSLSDLKQETIIYIAEDRTEYTIKEFEQEVRKGIKEIDEFKNLNRKQFNKCAKLAYDKVLNIISWEHPNTITDQFEDEDIEEILKGGLTDGERTKSKV